MWLLIGCAGGSGAVVRFLADRWLTSRINSAWPFATLIINVTGSFLLGLITGWCARHTGFSGWQTILGTGFLGGYTTFSAASVETMRLVHEKRTIAAVGHTSSMLAACVIAAGLGWAVMTLPG